MYWLTLYHDYFAVRNQFSSNRRSGSLSVHLNLFMDMLHNEVHDVLSNFISLKRDTAIPKGMPDQLQSSKWPTVTEKDTASVSAPLWRQPWRTNSCRSLWHFLVLVQVWSHQVMALLCLFHFEQLQICFLFYCTPNHLKQSNGHFIKITLYKIIVILYRREVGGFQWKMEQVSSGNVSQ